MNDLELEQRVIASLKEAGLIRKPRAWRWVAIAAMVALAFVGGRITADARSAPRGTFVLLLHGQSGGAGSVEAHRLWARSLRDRHLLVDAHKLGDFATVLGANGDRAGSVRGYFVVSAQTVAEARAIARECPHLRSGGWIEVRALER